MEELQIAMRAKAGLIWIITDEEMRVEQRVAEDANALEYEVWFWSATDGLVDKEGIQQGGRDSIDPSIALETLLKEERRIACIMRDLGTWLKDGPVVQLRKAKDLARLLPKRIRSKAIQVVVIDIEPPPKSLPTVLIEWPLPTRDEIGELFDNLVGIVPNEDTRKEISANGARAAVIDAAMGLTSNQVSIGLSKSLVKLKTFDPQLIAAEKRAAVRGSGLEWYDPDMRGMDAIGGLANLKKWLTLRHAGFTLEGKEYGLPTPKGVLLIGIPGSGKSLTAKCIAASWNVPLLRLDVGSLFNKWVGESERTMRKALQLAETVAPCVLWIDEIEKSGFGADGDAGTSQRVFATLLTWMQERTAAVFVVATANDIAKLPPEFMRAGRWDDVFFVDLPSLTERTEILEVLKKKYAQCDSIDSKSVAQQSHDYTGAELESGITAALYTQFAIDKPVDTEATIAEIQQMIPIAKSMPDKIKGIRDWAAQRRARPASPKEEGVSTTRAVELN